MSTTRESYRLCWRDCELLLCPIVKMAAQAWVQLASVDTHDTSVCVILGTRHERWKLKNQTELYLNSMSFCHFLTHNPKPTCRVVQKASISCSILIIWPHQRSIHIREFSTLRKLPTWRQFVYFSNQLCPTRFCTYDLYYTGVRELDTLSNLS